MKAAESLLPRRRRSLWLLLLLALPLFVALDDSSLWDANEAFYAQTPREMLARGDWLVPHFNGEPRLNKPPLSYWLVALFYKMLSVSVFWERFPMALLAYGCVWGVFFVGKLLGAENEVALLGAGIFGTSARFLLLARRLLIDTLMLFCDLWALVWFLLWLRSDKKSHFLLGCVFLGLAFLAKGPVGLLPALFLLVYFWVTGRASQLRRAPWLAGGLLCLVVCSFWYVLLGVRMGWGPVVDFFLRENLGRFASLSYGPARGPFYYVGVFFADFFPWSLLFPAAVAWAAAGWKRGTPGIDRRWLWLLSLWIGGYFLFFSLSRNKQEYYILPLYPLAAVWIAFYLERARVSRLLLGVVGVLLLAFMVTLFVLAQALFSAPWLWLPLLAVPVCAFGLFRRRYAYVVAGLAFFYFAVFAFYLEPFEAYKPVRPLAEIIRQEARGVGAEWQAGYYKLTAPSLAFYLDRPILELYDREQAAAILESETPVYLIVPGEDYAELARATTKPLAIVAVRPKL
ncbi:MAG: glycosyltransferase family 39 protein, partial [Acidobacteria bacterium]|nr:glycosyltransferase family 39 protein [Acidobacteriota bacterium]